LDILDLLELPNPDNSDDAPHMILFFRSPMFRRLVMGKTGWEDDGFREKLKKQMKLNQIKKERALEKKKGSMFVDPNSFDRSSSSDRTSISSEEEDIDLDSFLNDDDDKEFKEMEKKMREQIDKDFKKKEDEIFDIFKDMQKDVDKYKKKPKEQNTKRERRGTILFDILGQNSLEESTDQQIQELENQTKMIELQMKEEMLRLEQAEKRMLQLSQFMESAEIDIKVENVVPQKGTNIRTVKTKYN